MKVEPIINPSPGYAGRWQFCDNDDERGHGAGCDRATWRVYLPGSIGSASPKAKVVYLCDACRSALAIMLAGGAQ